MNSQDMQLIIGIGSLFLLFIFFYRGLLKFRKLTNYQIENRFKVITRQGLILAPLFAFSFGVDFLAKNYLYNFFVSTSNIFISLNHFQIAIFSLLTLIVLVFNRKFSKFIELRDNRIVNIEQESTFLKLKPKPRKLKKIKNYAHFYSGITYERSPKDYSVQNVHINVSKSDMEKFEQSQFQKQEINLEDLGDFYSKLVEYINLKSKIFKYEKITKEEISNTTNMFEFKLLIFNRFKILTAHLYFASVSQLFQVASSDQTEFLSFLRDSQHANYSSQSLKHAILFINKGVL